jgi:hypothetical protein
MVAPKQTDMKQQHSLERGDECIDRPAIEQNVHYRLLTLQNGLRALVVQDCEGDGMHDKAAAALDVRRDLALANAFMPACTSTSHPHTQLSTLHFPVFADTSFLCE